MSSLYRSAISARIAKLPGLPPNEDDDYDETEEGADSLGSLPTPGRMGPPLLTSSSRVPVPPNPDYAPIRPDAYNQYFSQAFQIELPTRGLVVRAYQTPMRGRGVMVMHHGAGYSSLSFACLAKELDGLLGKDVGMLAFDARRHGRTTPMEGQLDENLSMEVLVDDLVALVQAVFSDVQTAPVLMLVGHSMGGSVVTRACPKLQELKYVVSGVAVLDVVEGTAIEALPHMHALLDTRPEGFHSEEEAIEWHLNTRTINNPASARISVPSILVPQESKLVPLTRANKAFAFRWRTPLKSTAPYWNSWFSSLSTLFLSVRTGRLLILAGRERLDTTLEIGHMQGKFQLQVMDGRKGTYVGHLVQEDDPLELAEHLKEFWERNQRIEVRGKVIKRIGEA
ncbi:protein phosphatase methylesterase [Paxillus ammoniavirescens]|nr:protein phosphatase methylesterase [Paxillus ammoniavirescens]